VGEVREEELVDFIGNERADEWAKRAADDRPEQRTEAAVEAMALAVKKARKVVEWLAEGSWPDSKALGKAPSGVRERMRAGVKPPVSRHMWVWQGRRWGCVRCGVPGTRRRPTGGRCAGGVSRLGVHESHRLRDCTAGGNPMLVCLVCGGSRTGHRGLESSCGVLSSRASAVKRRLCFLRDDRHPYNGGPLVWVRGRMGLAVEKEAGEVLLGPSLGAPGEVMWDPGGGQMVDYGEGCEGRDPGLGEDDEWEDPLGLGSCLG
jgi:hypothetical protein